MEDKGISRREFLTTSAVGAAGLVIASSAFVPSAAFGANDRLSIGMIGVGSRGGQLLGDILKNSAAYNVEVTAVCDTWKMRRDAAAARIKESGGKEPRLFENYEDLLALKDLDAVVIASPDFSHARILTDALKAGKDVFVEKPMGKDLEQLNAAMDAQAAAKRIVQVGTQRRSEGYWKAAAKMVQSGVLGTISRVEVGWNDCGPRWRRNVTAIKREDVNWKRFLMHLPDRPFDEHRYGEWQLFRDYTNGPMAVLGAHFFDVALWVMNAKYPSTAVANGGQYVWKDGREHEDTVYAAFDFPEGFALRYCTGLGNSSEGGLRLYGTNGTFSDKTWSATGAGGRGASLIKEEVKLVREPSDNHMGNWLDCVRSRKAPNAPMETGYGHSVCTILGYQALISGKKMKFLPDERKIVEA